MNKKIKFFNVFIFAVLLSISNFAIAEVSVKVLSVSFAAEGAGAFIKLKVNCDPSFGIDSSVFLNATLSQTISDKKTSSASTSLLKKITCDGNPKKIRDVLLANGCNIPLKKGTAILRVSGHIYSNNFFKSEYLDKLTKVVHLR